MKASVSAPTAPTAAELGWGGNARDYRPEHRHDQQKRRHECNDDFDCQATPLLVADLECGCGCRAQPRIQDDPERIKQCEQQARYERAGEQVADRKRLGLKVAFRHLRLAVGALQDDGKEHKDRRGWNDLAERAGGADQSGRHALVVACLQHGG